MALQGHLAGAVHEVQIWIAVARNCTAHVEAADDISSHPQGMRLIDLEALSQQGLVEEYLVFRSAFFTRHPLLVWRRNYLESGLHLAYFRSPAVKRDVAENCWVHVLLQTSLDGRPCLVIFLLATSNETCHTLNIQTGCPGWPAVQVLRVHHVRQHGAWSGHSHEGQRSILVSQLMVIFLEDFGSHAAEHHRFGFLYSPVGVPPRRQAMGSAGDHRWAQLHQLLEPRHHRSHLFGVYTVDVYHPPPRTDPLLPPHFILRVVLHDFGRHLIFALCQL
mmetsp:Transcript_37621/g.86907  ORF Transcript_37621/g.86907 Transcript_37621/m.86907 type:complete len:276 (+) Transcript_37621:1739-2566(+)